MRSEPETIVRSILEPSAAITEGFELHTFVLKNGTVLSGAVLRENDAEIRIVKTDGIVEAVRLGSLRTRTKTKTSAMPTGFGLLGDEQIADIAAFLTTCRQGSIQR